MSDGTQTYNPGTDGEGVNPFSQISKPQAWFLLAYEPLTLIISACVGIWLGIFLSGIVENGCLTIILFMIGLSIAGTVVQSIMQGILIRFYGGVIASGFMYALNHALDHFFLFIPILTMFYFFAAAYDGVMEVISS